MKKLVLLVASLGLFAGLLGGAEGLKGLAVGDTEAKESALSAFVYGMPSWSPATRNAFIAASGSERAALTKAALGWVKSYTETAAFKAAYAKWREEGKPEAPASGNAGADLKRQQEEVDKQIAEMKKSMASLPPEQRKVVEQSIKEIERNMAERAADPQFQKNMLAGAEAVRAEAAEKYKEDIAAWQKDRPADSRVLIARRLREFLEVSADVDFEAKLVAAGSGRTRFADPEDEAKGGEWKLCYRAGKDAVGAARTFATSWLAQLTP
jgi:hypothetical protein